MDSQDTVDEVLQLMETLSQEDLQEKIDDFLPILTSSLGVEDENCRAIQIVHVLLNTCLPLVRIRNADAQILVFALPVLKQLFIESVNGVRYKFQSEETADQSDVIGHVEGLLKVCHLLLELVESGLNYVQSNEKIFINEIPSLPKNIGHILCEAFKHCRESEKLYGKYFRDLNEGLSMMFKKSHSIQGNFLATLTDNIGFNCLYEDEVVLLIEVLDILEEIGEVVTGLDVKTMAIQWKCYVKIVQENAEHLKQRIDIARPVNFLSLEIVNGLKSVLESDAADSKSITKNLKLINFQLKLVMLFCEQFVGYLGDCQNEILNLMLSVLGYSQPYLQLKKLPKKLIEGIESHVVIGIEPLLSHLISAYELPKAYFEFGIALRPTERQKLGFLLLTILILKNLIHCEEEVRRKWLQSNPNNNIVHVFFNSLNYSHVELTLNLQLRGSCKGPENEGVQSTHGLYEALLIHFTAFLTTVSCSRMKMVETILLKNILEGNGNFWCTLMTTDVWCMIARFGSAEFCFQQVIHLSRIFKKMSYNCSFPKTNYFRMLLSRLFCLLLNKDIIKMVELFPPVSNPRLWFVFGLSKLPEQIKFKIQEDLLANATENIEKFFSSSPAVSGFVTMRDALAGSCAALESLLNDKRNESKALILFIPRLIELWTCIPTLSSSQDNSCSMKWLDNFISDLSSATSNIFKELTNFQILQILQCLQNKILCKLYSIRIASIKILRSLAKKFFSSDIFQAKVFNEIASLFSSLLKDDNVLIQQMSLETFTYFSHHTQHEQIVALSVNDSEKVKELVRNYLRKIPFQVFSGEKQSLDEFLTNQQQGKVIHHCGIVNKKLKNQSPVKENEKVKVIFSGPSIGDNLENNIESQKRKSNEDLFVLMKRMKEDINYITEAYSQKVLPLELQAEVQEMASKLIKLT